MGSPECTDLLLNFLVAHISQRPPIKATHKSSSSNSNLAMRAVDLEREVEDFRLCFDQLQSAFGYMPLHYSWIRMDPVLFKDNVSMLRKEYRVLDKL